jgi:DNA-directed RNA polymerase alpha subunit
MEVHGGPTNRRRRKPADPDWVEFMSDDEKEADRIKGWQPVSLAAVGLPVRIVNILEDHNVLTVGQLCSKTVSELRNMQNLGEIIIKRCTNLLAELRLPNRLRG